MRELHNERLTPGTQLLAQLFLFLVNLINATPNLVFPRNATAISKIWKMPFHAISSGIFRSLEWRFSKFANCSGVFQSLQKLQWHFSKFGNCSGIFMNRHNWSDIYQICFWDGSRVSTGLCGHSGLSRHPFLLCLPQTSPVVFVLSEKG